MEDKNYYARKGYVSNSSLNYLIKSPKLFKQYLDGLVEEEDKSYFRFGQLVHLKVLEPEEFDRTVMVYNYTIPKSAQQKSFIEDCLIAYNKQNIYDVIHNEDLIKCYKNNYSSKEPDEKILEKAKKLYKEYNSYFNYLRLKDTKTIITTKEFDKINEMEANCRSHMAAKNILFDLPHPLSRDGEDSYNEFEILWDYGSVKCKSLIDRFIIDHNTKTIKLVDFKTTAKLHNFVKSFYDFGYDRQLVFYQKAIQYKFSEYKEYSFEWYIVACDTINHEVKAFRIKEEDLLIAKEEVKELLDRAKWHIENDKWDYSMEYHLNEGYEEL